jgi:hypothetical protein
LKFLSFHWNVEPVDFLCSPTNCQSDGDEIFAVNEIVRDIKTECRDAVLMAADEFPFR